MKAVRRLALAFLALPALLLAFLAVTAAPALAAPTWGIEMTHVNAYGAQAASCPGGHESLPGRTGLRRRSVHRQRHHLRAGKRLQHVHDQG